MRGVLSSLCCDFHPYVTQEKHQKGKQMVRQPKKEIVTLMLDSEVFFKKLQKLLKLYISVSK